MAKRVTVIKTITGQVIPANVVECEHANINMKRTSGDDVAVINFTGCKPDSDGWQLVFAIYTNVEQVTLETRVD